MGGPYDDREWFLELVSSASSFVHPEGWRIEMAAHLADTTPARPHGVKYRFVLLDPSGPRRLGFDNSNAYDRAPRDAPWDHEHRPGDVSRHHRYDFSGFDQLYSDFFDRVKKYCEREDIDFSAFSVEVED
jgi:hypothetical protein